MTHEGKNGFFWGLLLVTIGAVWLAYNLGLINGDLWKYWPLVFVVAGLWVVMNRSLTWERQMAALTRELHKSATNRVLAGVCGGIGEYLDVDPTLVRFVFVIFTLWGGIGLLAYLILIFIMPEAGQSSSETAAKLRATVAEHRVSVGKTPSGRGASFWLAIALIVIGVFWLLANTGFLAGVAWAEVWPISVIILGLLIWLLTRGRP